jgi:7-cyano-7-deazaguanine reductase
MSKNKKWSDPSILQTLPNPSKSGYEIRHKSHEFTFIGVPNQPDHGTIFITFYPGETIIELKSLKLYLQDFRNRVISYERLLNVIYKDIMAVYKPTRLRLVIVCAPRGGISSRLNVDSDWSIRGGKEEFRDWVGQPDEW